MTHDGTLGRMGELRGRPEDVVALKGSWVQDLMILDERCSESPRQSLERRFEHLKKTWSRQGDPGKRTRFATRSNLRNDETAPVIDSNVG